ncbi:hemolysin family protein [Entomobacter blattae]|uniref:HlyC/CorC family transporter n=1 Tax=Entomobacter blattae TaxID=2762277 RepID=A0A7H1NPZ7_9PROT|nr:hemolysin family protein [Entomobacter blattae]QNT77857.1 hypothetical protein JGUZn3_06150 [Entomobacter blattae]
MLWSIIVIFFLIFFNGLFAMGELALISARRARLAVLVKKKTPGAERAMKLADDPQSFLPTVQVGITLVSILEGTFGGAKIERELTPWIEQFPVFRPFSAELSIAIVVVTITSLMLVFGELVPKQLALRKPEIIAARLSWMLQAIAVVVRPVVWLLGYVSTLVLSLMGVGKASRETVTEEELRAFIAEGAQAGVLEIEEHNMIERLLRLADRSARAVMSPRNELVWLERQASRQDLIKAVKESSHTRLVVCEGGIDNPVGVIFINDLLGILLEGKAFSIEKILYPPVAVPDSMSALNVLERLRSSDIGLVLVLDEYGSFEGIVTAGDVFEAIVGGEKAQKDKKDQIQAHPIVADTLELEGFLPVDEIRANLDLAEEPPAYGSYHTLAGMILALLRRIPAVGDKVVFSGWLFEVTEMEGRKITKIKASRQILAEN